jgi:small subunit ribosomal protein S18
MSEPKTIQRRINFRKHNKSMTNKRLDLPFEKISYQNPEVLSKFTTETGPHPSPQGDWSFRQDASRYHS